MIITAPPVGVRGFLRLQTINKFSGKITQDTGFFPNSVLVTGKNRMGEFNGWFAAGQVGTNNTPANDAQTGLLGYVAGTTATQPPSQNSYGAQSTAPYYGWRQYTFRHSPPGGLAKLINEAGAGWATSGAALWHRARVVDPLGVETTVSWQPDEYLDLTVQIRYYPPLASILGTISIQSVSYDYILKAAEVTSGDAWGKNIGSMVGKNVVFASDWAAYDGNLSATITGIPSGVRGDIDNTANVVNQAYSSNSFSKTISFNVGPTGWIPSSNLGIRSLLFRTTAGSYQIQFNGPAGVRIPKTSSKTMNGTFRVAWAEAVIP